jgi:hypothetical protein
MQQEKWKKAISLSTSPEASRKEVDHLLLNIFLTQTEISFGPFVV